MTATDDQHWASIALTLEHGWPTEFPAAAEMAYKSALGKFPARLIAHAVQSLATAGAKFRPSVGEVAAECHRIATADLLPTEFSVEVIEAAAWTTRGRTHGAGIVAHHLGPVAAAWFLTTGCELVRSLELGQDSKYAGVNRGKVTASWEQYANRHLQRVLRGADPTASLNAATTRVDLRAVPTLKALPEVTT